MRKLLAGIFGILLVTGLAVAEPPDGNQGKKKGKFKSIPLAQTGQQTSYGTGDDGDLKMGVPGPDPRFIDHGDGAATDSLTGFMWATEAGQYTIRWVDALQLCNSFFVGSLDDWRLPNIKELLSIVDVEQSHPLLPAAHPFVNVSLGAGTGSLYWTSTTNPVFDTKNDAYAISLDTGEIRVWNKTSGGYVLCVRGGW